ncbi:MAG: hypothetical protein ABEI32_10290 [Halothece sp.]
MFNADYSLSVAVAVTASAGTISWLAAWKQYNDCRQLRLEQL